MESFARESAVHLTYLFVWAWRGAYFAAGVIVVLWLLAKIVK